MSKVDYHLLSQQGVHYVSNSDKFLRYLVICLIGAGTIYWYYFSLYGSIPSPHFYSPSKLKSHSASDVDSFIENWNESKPLCSAPEILNQMLDDPFIQKYTKKVSLECNKKKIYTKLDQETALLTLTDEAVEDEVSCFYSFLWRSSGQDNYIDYSGIDPIPDSGVQITNENDIANVSCTKDGGEVYRNTHMWIPDLKPSVESRSHGQPSLLVLFLESLSSVSFNRYMKKAKKSLENLGNVFYLNGFVKHNDNSFPNSVSMLTGDRIDWEYEEKVKSTFFDDVTPKARYLWDDFSSKGYVTGFLEDMAIVGIFNYAKRGWKAPPVDWYPRAFWVQMYPESGSFKIWNSMNELAQFCFNGPKVDTFLDQVYSFMKKMNGENQPFFLFAFYSQMTHDNINNYQMVDEPFANFFDRTKSMYNNTLLVFAGDHGPRYGSPSVPSGFGRLEERLNLVTVRVPESLDSKYPHLKKYLTGNRDRLTSWIDVHEMIKDVALESYSPVMEVAKKSGPISPWRELVHPDRTCDDAHIFRAYCVCNGTINTDSRAPEKYDIYWAYKAVEHFVKRAIEKAKRVEPEKYSDCIPEQIVITNSTSYAIDMKYIIPQIGENFMTDRIRISVFLKPSNVWLATEITVVHHADHFNIVDDEERVLKVVCKT